MRMRDKVMMRHGPGAFSGAPLPVWLRVLADNRCAVDWPYWTRAAVITAAAVPNTLTRWFEALLYNNKVRRTEIEPPLFVLGIWRSGTTHLHNLLAVDDRFGFANFYQVMNPWTFLLTERTNARLASLFLPPTRPQDNVKLAMSEPQEDEFALCSLIGRSLLLSMAFPRNQPFYDRYLTLQDLTPQELRQWKSALVWFLKKLSFKHRRPLVLKSPGHTCRIEVLLELFPEARFVHIHRHPYEVFQSAAHTLRKVVPWWQLQRTAAEEDLADQLLRQHREVYDAYFAQRDQIPAGRLHELAFDDLQQDPLGQVRDIYRSLALPDVAHVEPRLQQYIESLSGYQKNKFPQLPNNLRERIQSACQPCFEQWAYRV